MARCAYLKLFTIYINILDSNRLLIFAQNYVEGEAI